MAVSAPNKYMLPKMLGNTVESTKKAAPSYSVVGRSKIGGFHEDLQKVPTSGSAHVRARACVRACLRVRTNVAIQ